MRGGSSSSAGYLNVKNGFEISHHPAYLEQTMLRDRPTTEFVKGMTHELRTPLNVIIGLCQLLERDVASPLSPEQRDSVDRMERNAHSLLQTVNHLLTCLRSGRLE